MECGRTKNTLYNAAGGIIVRIISIITAFVTRTVFINVLGLQYAGVSGVFSDILVILSFAELGIGQAIVYALYKPIAEENNEKIAILMTTYKKIYSIIACIIFCVGMCLLPVLKFIINDVPDVAENIRLIYVLYLVNTSTSYLLIYKSTFLTAMQKDYLVSKFKSVFAVFRAIIECTILLLFKNYILYLLISIIINIMQNYMIARVAEKEYPILKVKSLQKLNMLERRNLFKDVRALALYKVSGTVLSGTDSVVTSTILGTSLVGILGNYNLIVNQVYSMIMQIFTATSASIGNLAITSTIQHQHRIFKQLNFFCFWVYCISATCLWTLLNMFMIMWQGKEFLFDSVVVAFLIIEFYMKGMLSPVSQFRTSNGLFVQGKYRPIIMAVINIFLSIIFANKIGIAGVILGTIVARVSTQLWYDAWLIYKEIFKCSALEYYKKYIKQGMITALSCMISRNIVLNIYETNNIIQLILGLLVSIIISNCFVITCSYKEPEFKELVNIFLRVIKSIKGYNRMV